MRLQQPNCSAAMRTEIAMFDPWIKDIGNGVSCSALEEESVLIPPDLMVTRHNDPISNIVNATYPNIIQCYGNKEYLASKIVLAPHHEMVNKINSYILSQLPREEVTYLSSAYVDSDNGKHNTMDPDFPAELLNSLQVPGFPDHDLKLKISVPIILLRNIDQRADALCGNVERDMCIILHSRL
ncbi:hypothetical protein LINGRAHAP2_LOCUS1672 [Linum grandiflorum]